jgi:hypothetical protein
LGLERGGILDLAPGLGGGQVPARARRVPRIGRPGQDRAMPHPCGQDHPGGQSQDQPGAPETFAGDNENILDFQNFSVSPGHGTKVFVVHFRSTLVDGCEFFSYEFFEVNLFFKFY